MCELQFSMDERFLWWEVSIAVSECDSHIPGVGRCQWGSLLTLLFMEDLKDVLDDGNWMFSDFQFLISNNECWAFIYLILLIISEWTGTETYYAETIHTGWTPENHWNTIEAHHLKQFQDLKNGYITHSSLSMFLFRFLFLFSCSS